MARKSNSEEKGNSEELTRLLNLTLPQCYNLANSGIIPKSNNGAWDLNECAKAYIQYLQGHAGHEKRAYAVERTRLTKAQADKAEMELRILEGKLIPATVVEAVWSGMTGAARKRLMAVPYRMATAAIAAENFPAIESAAMDLITEALNEIHGFDPADYSDSVAGERLDVETSPPTHRQSVGGSGTPPQPRGQRRTRTVAD